MATEEQTSGASLQTIKTGRAGQKLTITNRIVSKLSFKAYLNVGSPTGNVNYVIRKVSDDSVIVSKAWGDASSWGGDQVYREVTFDTPVFINEEVRIMIEYEGGATNYIKAMISSSDVKADEHHTRYDVDYSEDASTWDFIYIYTYLLGDLPTVTTQSMSSVVTTTATGNGNVTDLGDTDVTQHGHCWNTTGTPTTSSTKTTNGAKAATGAFTSALTGLTSATKYYVRAYATNSGGTSYGEQVIFIAGALAPGEGSGIYAVVEDRFHYVDAYGVERYVKGTVVP